MCSVSYGNEISVVARTLESAREALAIAEEYVAANRPNVTVIDLLTKQPIPLDDLRERAEVEANNTPSPQR